MKVRVLYFAALRERVGRSEETVDVPDKAVLVLEATDHFIALRSSGPNEGIDGGDPFPG